VAPEAIQITHEKRKNNLSDVINQVSNKGSIQLVYIMYPHAISNLYHPEQIGYID
jgi:hypothetical protein